MQSEMKNVEYGRISYLILKAILSYNPIYEMLRLCVAEEGKYVCFNSAEREVKNNSPKYQW